MLFFVLSFIHTAYMYPVCFWPVDCSFSGGFPVLVHHDMCYVVIFGTNLNLGYMDDVTLKEVASDMVEIIRAGTEIGLSVKMSKFELIFHKDSRCMMTPS